MDPTLQSIDKLIIKLLCTLYKSIVKLINCCDGLLDSNGGYIMHLSMSSPTTPQRVGVGWGFDTQEVQSLRPLGQNYRKIPLFIKFHGSCVLTLPCAIINGVLMYMCNNCTLSTIKCPSHPLLGQIPHPLGRNLRQWTLKCPTLAPMGGSGA